jgi:hypothetical protein
MATGVGRVRFLSKVGNDYKRCVMSNVLYAPDINCNVMSVAAVTRKHGQRVVLDSEKCMLLDSAGKVIAKGVLRGNMYLLMCYVPMSQEVSNCDMSARNSLMCDRNANLNIWHARLGHSNSQRLQNAVKNHLVQGITGSIQGNLGFCDSCIQGKQKMKSFPRACEVKATYSVHTVDTQ